MSKRTSAAALFFTVLVVSTLPVTAQVRRRVVVARPHEEPCWQVVGISKSAMEERQAIARQTRAEVEAVCANGSLTPQQRQQRIREIHQQAKQKSEGLITPQQQESLQACQKERAANHPPGFGGHRAGGTGPCGEQSSGPKHPARSGGGGSHEPAEEEIPPQ